MQIAQGNVADRPFARTIFSLASKRFTGDLILTKSRQEYRSSWENGQIVAATSPSPADSPGRIALANGLVNSSTLGIFVQRVAAEPHSDPSELLAEIAKLTPDQTIDLKRRGLARSAARMFALPGADFVVDNARSMRADPQVPPLDLRWLIYFGLRTHYSLERLATELAALGDRSMSLPAQALPMLPAFAFAQAEDPVLKRLMSENHSLENLVAACEGVDPATTTCVVYALMACGYLAFGEEQRSKTPRRPRTPTAVGSSLAGPTAAAPSMPARRFSASRPVETVQGVGFIEPSPKNAKRASANKLATDLINKLIALLDNDADYYQLLGLSRTATDAEVRKSYFDLARKLHPDHLQSIGLVSRADEAQRLFAAINKAFAVLSNPKELSEYKKILAAGGVKAYAKEQQAAEDLATKIFRAEEHFHVGEMALRRDQFGQAEIEFRKASELSPDESEYLAMYAWAMYCNAKDRAAAEPIAMQKVSGALLKGPMSINTRLYHAKLLKLMGRVPEALASFRALLAMSPEHREAELEIRLLSKREKSESEAKKGLFGRKR